MNNIIICGDCLDVIKDIPSNSVDMVYSNPPFGVTKAKWDKPLSWVELWPEIWRVSRLNGAVLLHSSMPFTFDLVSSQRKYFKYNYVWVKNTHTGFFQAKNQPLRRHEDVCVFYRKQPTYNPQMKGTEFYKKRIVKYGGKEEYWGKAKYEEGEWGVETVDGGHYGKYPDTVLYFKTTKAVPNESKPSTRTEEMVEFFIKTYTNVGDVVLDITANNGLTGIVCKNLNRNYILIEKDNDYYELAKSRLDKLKGI